jgi:hypothetical protein
MTGINYKAYCELQKEIEELSRRKNHDYGSDSLVSFGNFGILVRMSDKFDRLKTLFKSGVEAKVQDEKVEDTLKDVVNYALYIILQSRGKLLEGEKDGKSD